MVSYIIFLGSKLPSQSSKEIRETMTWELKMLIYYSRLKARKSIFSMDTSFNMIHHLKVFDDYILPMNKWPKQKWNKAWKNL